MGSETGHSLAGHFMDSPEGIAPGPAIFAGAPRAPMTANSLRIRTARIEELGALHTLMELAIGELLKPFLNAAEVASSRTIMGLDSQLVADGTYFVVEADGV